MSISDNVRAGLGSILLVNAVPHGVAAAIRKPFPSPFADPPGVGLSGPAENAAWSAVNLVGGSLLVGRVFRRPPGRQRGAERTRAEKLTTAVVAVSTAGFLTWYFGVSAPTQRSRLAGA